MNPTELFYKISNKAKDSSNTDSSKKLLGHAIFGAGTIWINNEIKYIMKLIKSLENRVILLTGTTAKSSSQKGGFLNFVRPLVTAGLPLIKNVLTLSARIVLIPLGLTAAAATKVAAIQKKNYGSVTTALIISN